MKAMTGGQRNALVSLATVIVTAGVLLRVGGVDMPLPPLLHPAALAIVLGSTIGLACCMLKGDAVAQVPVLLIIREEVLPEPRALAALFISFSEKARKEGLLALEEDIEMMKDKPGHFLLRNSLQLVVDGVDPEYVHRIISRTIAATVARHHSGQNTILHVATATVAGGALCSLFFLATGCGPEACAGIFWGLLAACLLWLPAYFRLRHMAGREHAHDELVKAGILSVMSGDNPRIVHEILFAAFPAAERAIPYDVEPGSK